MSTILAALISLLFLASAAPAGVQDVESQLDEVRRLLRAKQYSIALDDLKFIAQQIQELRLEEIRPLFPEAPPGWNAAPPLRTSREDDLWSRRLEVRTTYTPEEGTRKVDLALDFYSPLIPRLALSFNPLYVAGDPQVKIVDIAGEDGRLRFNPDTGEGELILILDKRVLISVRGRGIASESVLKDFITLLDFPAILAFTLL